MPVYVREFEHLAKDREGTTVAAPNEPALADQTITVSASPANITLDERTRFVEIHTTESVHYVFDATAGTGNMVLPTNGTIFKGVRANGGSVTLSARTTV